MPGPADSGSVPDAARTGSLFIGLMSGTSMDGIDAALVTFGEHRCNLVATCAAHYPHTLRNELLEACRMPAQCTVDTVGRLDQWVGECFRDAALQVIAKAKVQPESITAIGSHGQTLRHQPRAARPFSLQIGDANIIAAGTGITTVADFRRRDIALGGEGAPLAPAFHRWLFADTTRTRVVLNIGGIANVTILSASGIPVIGFDTGPGNSLLDAWIRNHRNAAFDESGEWARSGSVNETLLGLMLEDPFFGLAPPKSTGFEHFNIGWVRSKLATFGKNVAAADVQATLAELSARSIAQSILQYATDLDDVLVCGGGVHNMDMMRRLGSHLTGVQVSSTAHHGLHPDWVEAAAFAWLARRCLEGKVGNLPDVTGASRPAVLGAIYLTTG